MSCIPCTGDQNCMCCALELLSDLRYMFAISYRELSESGEGC
jgi:hypothetical protein